MLSKPFHRSARPNRTHGRRGPSLALETLETRTVMTTFVMSNAVQEAPSMAVAGGPAAISVSSKGYLAAAHSTDAIGVIDAGRRTSLPLPAGNDLHNPLPYLTPERMELPTGPALAITASTDDYSPIEVN